MIDLTFKILENGNLAFRANDPAEIQDMQSTMACAVTISCTNALKTLAVTVLTLCSTLVRLTLTWAYVTA